jgi:AraC-like DNA-binding protein
MFLILPPDPRLSSFVKSYWFIEDIPGEHEGRPIRTSPIPSAVLSVNVGRPNATEDGSLVPSASLLGLQRQARSWQSWSDTYFVMAMLTARGLVRLFPYAGSASADRLLDLGALAGDATTRTLARGVAAAWTPQRIANELDRWLLGRLATSDPVPENNRLARAHSVLKCGGTVKMAADEAKIDRRHLHRWCHRHFGIGPKEVAELERLQNSLRSIQAKTGDGVDGFSDQAHQIRNWRRRLGVTPGAYRDDPRSPLATYFSAIPKAAETPFYL